MAVANPALNDQAFARGGAGPGEVGARAGMTAGGTYLITAGLLVLVIAAAVFGWSQTEVLTFQIPNRVPPAQRVVAHAPDWVGLVALLAFIVAMVGAFAPRAAIITGPLYALGQGAVLGVASHYYDVAYPGIVLQAVGATIAVFAMMLFLYAARIVRVTPRFAMGVIAAMGGLMLLYATTWLLSLFGADFTFLFGATPLGIALSVGVVALGALNLPLNFDFIEQSAARGAPKYMEWFGAYGLMLSLIWMYTSILRLLALLRGSRR